MTIDVSTWESAVREQVRIIAGDWADEVTAAWATFADEPLVVVTLHGGYDTGKTSLIKRFLVEDGTPLPDGLDVGARPTSYQARRITSGGLVWVDTPGTDSGNEEHDMLAEEALMLTDAVLVVLSPQLLSGGQDVVKGLIDGTFHNPVAEVPMFADGALVVAVSQMDTGGVTPWDDQAGYERLIERKREELTAALGTGAGVVAQHLHFVAADPEEAGPQRRPRPEDYTGREDWDGVVALRADLQSLAGRQPELRRGAGVRYWSWVGDRARQRATAELERLERVVDEARRSAEVTDLLLEELEGIDRNARARLREAVYDGLMSGITLADDPDGNARRSSACWTARSATGSGSGAASSTAWPGGPRPSCRCAPNGPVRRCCRATSTTCSRPSCPRSPPPARRSTTCSSGWTATSGRWRGRATSCSTACRPSRRTPS